MAAMPVVRHIEIGLKDLAVVELPLPSTGSSGAAGAAARRALADLALAGDAPLQVVRRRTGDCVVVPSGLLSDVVRRAARGASGDDGEAHVQLCPAGADAAAAPLRRLAAALAAAGVEALTAAAPLDPRPSVLVRAGDLPKAVHVLAEVGLVVDDLGEETRGPLSGGSWGGLGVVFGRSSAASAPGVFWRHGAAGGAATLRFESGRGPYLVLSLPAGPAAEAVRELAAPLRNGHGPGAASDEDGGWARFQTRTDGEEQGTSFTVLELLATRGTDGRVACAGRQRGVWIFAGKVFARAVGFAMQEAEALCEADVSAADGVPPEARDCGEAVLGVVEAPGRLRTICRSFEPRAAGKPFLDASTEAEARGTVEVHTSARMVVHRNSSGLEQHWRIVEQRGPGPFGPTAAARGALAVAAAAAEERTEAAAASASADGLSRPSTWELPPKAVALVAANGASQRPKAGDAEDSQALASLIRKAKEEESNASSSEERRSRSRSRDRAKERAKEKAKEKEKDKEKGKAKERDREAEKESGRKDKERERDREKEKEKDKDREREREKEKDRRSRDREKEKDRDRKEKDRDRDKDDRDRDREKERERDRERTAKPGGDLVRKEAPGLAREGHKESQRDRGPGLRSRERERERERAREREKARREKKKSRSASSGRSPPRRSTRGFDKREPQPGQMPPPSTALALIQQQQTQLMVVQPPQAPAIADPEVEAFLALNPVDAGTAARFRALPLNLQRMVLVRGSLVGTRDPSAVLMSRVRDAIQNGGGIAGMGMAALGGAPAMPMAMGLGAPVAGSNPEVESFLAANPVDFQAASRLRALPPHLQRFVLIRGSLSGVRDASSVLMSRVRDALAGGGMAMAMGAPPPPLTTAAAPNYRAGDWMCPKCSFHNYSSKIICTQCGTPMAMPGAVPASGSGIGWAV